MYTLGQNTQKAISMNPLKILFPTDFSNRAEKALEEAISFCDKTRGELLIYHVYHRPYSETGSSADMEAKTSKLEMQIEKKFLGLEKNHKHLHKIKHGFRKELGSSIEKIVALANEDHIDLIISATKGAKGFGELWGTKTEKIIKEVNIPVLIIPDDSSIDGLKKIGLTCDYSNKTVYESLEMLIDLAEHFTSNVDVISLNQDVMDMAKDDNQTSEENRNRKLVRSLLEDVDTSFDFTFNEDVERGILEYCRENEIDLIAILPKHYSFFQKLFHISLTKKMIFHSPIPLLVLK